jgi:hypothetical protein
LPFLIQSKVICAKLNKSLADKSILCLIADDEATLAESIDMNQFYKILTLSGLVLIIPLQLHAKEKRISKLPKELVGNWIITDVVTTPSSFTRAIGGSSKEEYEKVKKAIRGKTIIFGEKTFSPLEESFCIKADEVEWSIDSEDTSPVLIAEDMRKYHRNARSGSHKTDHALALAACSGKEAPTFEEAIKLKSYTPVCLGKTSSFITSKISSDMLWGGFIVLDHRTMVMDNDDWYICLKKND